MKFSLIALHAMIAIMTMIIIYKSISIYSVLDKCYHDKSWIKVNFCRDLILLLTWACSYLYGNIIWAIEKSLWDTVSVHDLMLYLSFYVIELICIFFIASSLQSKQLIINIICDMDGSGVKQDKKHLFDPNMTTDSFKREIKK